MATIVEKDMMLRDHFTTSSARRSAACLALAAAFGASGARADDELQPSLGPNPTVATSLPRALGNWNGLRSYLFDKGISFAINYTSDTLGNTTGGLQQGMTYMGRAEGVVEVDFEKAFGWTGGLFHVGAYQIHGIGLSRHFIGSFQPVSDLEALATTRLDEIYLEQKLFDGKFAIKVGQIAADTEFFLTPFNALPVGGAYGWPAILSQNLPNGGPAYPFASPGVRVKFQPNENVALLAAIYDGDPVGLCPTDPQKCNRYGTKFRFSDPPFVIGEAQFKYELPFQGGLAGNVRPGAWAHFGKFGDLRLDAFGYSLADVNSSGLGIQHRGNRGFYVSADQQIYRPGEEAGKGVFVWSRFGIAPKDRNPVDLYVDGGVNFVGMVPGRPDDQFGFMGAFARISPDVTSVDLDRLLVNAAFGPVRDYEALLQATYAFQVVPGFVIQPNIQYVFHPAGHIPDLHDPFGTRAVGNAFVAGVRMAIKY
jgi:porin